MKTFIIGLIIGLMFVGSSAYAQNPIFWYPNIDDDLTPAVGSWGINLPSGDLTVGGLVSCDTIDTDANGIFSCGTDANTTYTATLPLFLSGGAFQIHLLTSDLGVSGNNLYVKDTGIDHDGTTNFVANEHIDWTSASDNFSTTGTLSAATSTISVLTVSGTLTGTLTGSSTDVSCAECLIIGTEVKAGTLTDTKYCIWDSGNSQIVCNSTPAGAGDITDIFSCATGDCDAITVADGDLLDFSNATMATTTTGIILGQAASCSSATAEGQICWDTDNDNLYVGDSSGVVHINAGGSPAWDDISNPDANDEIDFAAYVIELNVENFQIGDGGANFVDFNGTPLMSFQGNADIDLPNDSVDAADINTITCGTNCTWDAANDEIDVDDAFLLLAGDTSSGDYTMSGTWSMATTTVSTLTVSENINMADDKYLYFDTAKDFSINYDTNYTMLRIDDGSGGVSGLVGLASPYELSFYANSADDGSGTYEPYIRLNTDGSIVFYNCNEGAERSFYVAMDDGMRMRTTGDNAIRLKADNITGSDKTFQFPNLTGTLVTTVGAGANVDLGAYTFTAATSTISTLTVSGTLTGEASTATALAANGGNCNAGEYALGVDASGAVENCTDATTEINSVVNGLGGTNLTCSSQSCNVDDSFVLTGGDEMTGNLTFDTGTVTIAGIQNQNLLDKTVTETITGTWSMATTTISALTATGTLTGNASTATALASNPTDCGANTWATTIAANGNLTCAAVTYAGISAMTSANWAGVISDETGSGKLTFATAPVFTTSITITGADAVPDVAGEIQYDSTVTGMSGGALRWFDNDSVRILVDLETDATDDDYVVSYDADADGFYMKLDANDGGATAWDDITNPDASDEIDFAAHTIELNVADFQIGDGAGSNYVGFDGTPTMTFAGTADINLPDDSVDDADINWGGLTDLVAGGEVSWGNIAEGELADSTVVSADIKADVITHANILDSDQTDTKCLWFEDPTAADDFKSVWRNSTGNDLTLTELWAESDQTVTFMLQVDDGSPADIDSVDLAPAAGEAEDTSLDGDTTLAQSEELDLDLVSVSGTPTWVSICWTFTWND